MISDADMRAFCDNFIAAGVIRKKATNKWCHRVNNLWNYLTRSREDSFLKRASTVGKHIYMPDGWDYATTPLYQTYVTLKHEAEHLHFFTRFGLVFGLILYLFLPLPVFFAYGRYRMERRAAVEELLAISDIGGDAWNRLNLYSDALTNVRYFYTWYSKHAVRRWLNREYLRRRDAAANLDPL